MNKILRLWGRTCIFCPIPRISTAIAQLHEAINKAVCWDNDVKFNAMDSEAWDAILKLPEMKPETYRNLAKDLANIQGAEIDLYTLADPCDDRRRKARRQDAIYMHRILHDLDRQYFNHDQISDFWGVTETIRHLTDAEEVVPDTRAEVAKHIDKNVKLIEYLNDEKPGLRVPVFF